MSASHALRKAADPPSACPAASKIGNKKLPRQQHEVEVGSMVDMDMMGDLGWLGMGVMWLWAIVPVALVVGGGWLLARAAGGGDGRRQADDAAAILRRRLAAGEIDVEQYDKARAALGLSERHSEGDPPG